MSGKKETYVYGSLRERFALEWKIFALAFVFILIADNIGQIKIPVGKGMFILFPIFYAIILGVLSGPQVLKIVDNRHVKAASKLVVVGICPFIAKLGITAGPTSTPFSIPDRRCFCTASATCWGRCWQCPSPFCWG